MKETKKTSPLRWNLHWEVGKVGNLYLQENKITTATLSSACETSKKSRWKKHKQIL